MIDQPTQLSEQIAYYRARAAEYDEWFERRGRYDHGDEHRRLWQEEATEVRGVLEQFNPGASVLELAGGTGIWTERLLEHAAQLSVFDAAEEMLELNRFRCQSKAEKLGVTYETKCVDIFSWKPERQWDVVFFSFWLSHVPESHFVAFWEQVKSALAPDGRCFFIDSKLAPGALAVNHPHPDLERQTATRKLNDGREFDIVKRFYDPSRLLERLRSLGMEGKIASTRNFFLYGELTFI
jgi:2-polyprenyl-3-methyl-5-hydroxy-6-metoxy-1,4-benzoquinol methylase